MNKKEYEIFQLRMKIANTKKTLDLLEKNEKFYLFNSQGASYYELDQDEAWENIRKTYITKIKNDLELQQNILKTLESQK